MPIRSKLCVREEFYCAGRHFFVYRSMSGTGDPTVRFYDTAAQKSILKNLNYLGKNSKCCPLVKIIQFFVLLPLDQNAHNLNTTRLKFKNILVI